MDIDALGNHVKDWLNLKIKGGLALNGEAIADSLVTLDTTAVLRYTPADNGYCEDIVVFGNKEFIENKIEQCLDFEP
ncbi:hypothetical protein [Polycladidibacter stylochi]|uniref:hypothetical protein n=1 Tax=Polycladidibacter stylochi TaxID=1807766 RepID=UPI00083370CF|nr:hypothetical protein [Pseudovibrio stylochi]